MPVSVVLLIVVMVLFIAVILATIAALYWTKRKKMIQENVDDKEGNFRSVHILRYTHIFFSKMVPIFYFDLYSLGI